MASDTAAKVVKAIVNGRFDSQLERFNAAITRRQQALVQIKAATFEVGDRVVVNQRIKPRYLYGAEGTIIGTRGERFAVDLDRPRRRYWKNIGFLPVSIDLLEED